MTELYEECGHLKNIEREYMNFPLSEKKYYSGAYICSTGLKREKNEDAVLYLPESGCFVVSDGMGGGGGGEIASRMVIERIRSLVVKPNNKLRSINKAIYLANSEIFRYSNQKGYKGMGATVAGMRLEQYEPSRCLWFAAGDSRVYLLRSSKLRCLSSDHTIAAAMGVEECTLPRHTQGVLTNVVGIGASFFLDSDTLDIKNNDCFLICSDGLSRQVTDKQIEKIMLSGKTPDEMITQMIELSENAGGADNISIILLFFGNLPELSPEAIAEINSKRDALTDGDDDSDETTTKTET